MSLIAGKTRKLLALLLALCLPLSLAACGKDEKEGDDRTEQLSDTVYVPEFLDLSAAGEIDSLQSACAIGNGIFLLATVTGKEASDPVTGSATSTALFRVDTDGTVERLTNYEPLPVPEGMDGYSDPANIAAGPGDTLWVTEYMTYYKLDLPEDFDPVYGSKSNYMTGYTERKMLRQLDTTGSEITRLDTTYLSRKLAPAGTGFSYGDSTSEYLIDGEGNLWTALVALTAAAAGDEAEGHGEDKQQAQDLLHVCCFPPCIIFCWLVRLDIFRPLCRSALRPEYGRRNSREN